MASERTEMERKYLVNDENAFNELLGLLEPKMNRPLIADFLQQNYSSKQREYRYFDTFDGDISKLITSSELIGPLEKMGVSISARDRGDDYMLSVKMPTSNPEERTEWELPIHATSGTNFYALEPKDFAFHWTPMRKIMDLCQYKPLQEIVRLTVQTTRVDLYSNRERKVEIALDYVVGRIPLPLFDLSSSFYELEIEQKETGKPNDVEKVAGFLTEKFPEPKLVNSSTSKWIKALKLIRKKGSLLILVKCQCNLLNTLTNSARAVG